MAERVFRNLMGAEYTESRDDQAPAVANAIANVQQDTAAALTWLEGQTKRRWAPEDDASERLFAAPDGSLLGFDGPDEVVELLPVPTPSIKVYSASQALTSSTDYRLLYNRERTAYTQIERRANSLPAYWTAANADADVSGQIAITGKWAAADIGSLPADIATAWEAKAMRIGQRRGFQQGAGGGSTVVGAATDDSDLAAMILPYWRQPAPQIVRLGV